MANLTDTTLVTNKTALDASTSTLSLMHKYFLVTLVLAAVSAVLGSIYGYIEYYKKRKSFCCRRLDSIPRRRHSNYEDTAIYKVERRKTSTHIVLSATQSKQSARRMSSAFL